MKKKIVFIIISLYVFSISCTSQSNRIIESKGNSLYVIPQGDKTKNIDGLFLYSSLYKGIKTILLETDKSCLIGSVSKMRVYDNYILILDRLIAKSLFVFDKEGHFIRKIGNIGQGPGEFARPYDFTIDKENKTIYILDGSLQRINKYDITTGTFIHAINLDRRARSHRIEYMGGKLYADAYFQEHSDDNYLLRIIQESSGMEEGHYLNVMKYHKGISKTLNITNEEAFYLRGNGNIVFVQPFMDHIIAVNSDSIFSLVNFKGKDVLTSEEIKRAIKKDDFMYNDELRKLNKYYQLYSFIEQKNWILIEYFKGVMLQKIFVDKQTNDVSIFEKGMDDLLKKEKGDHSVLTKVGCYDADGVYFYVTQNSMLQIQALAKAGVFSPDLDRLEDIKYLEEDANPILFYYEFKD